MLAIRPHRKDLSGVAVGAGPSRAISDAADAAWGWAPTLALLAGLSLLATAVADGASRNDAPWAYPLFAVSVTLVMLPLCARVLWPDTSRHERIALLLIAALALFGLRVIHEPLHFADHDAFLHWATTLDILETRALFRANPLLPISPLYPGLELITTAICDLTGLAVFDAARIVSAATRVVFVLGLFLVYERISGSSRVAATGTLIYMSCASFVYFDSMYSYGSLALAILVIILLAGGIAMSEPRWRVTLLVMTPLLTALAITHHLTGFIAASLLSCLAALEWLGSGWSLATRWRLANAAIAAALVAGWSSFVGNPSEGYLVPVFQDAWVEAKDVMSLSGGRALFQSEDGMLMPAWQRYITLFSVALVCVGLAVGFLHALAWSDDNAGSHRLTAGWQPQWHNRLLVLLTGLTLLFPLCVLLKLTRAGWEVGNRISPFAYLGVGVVVAIGIAVVWLNSSRSISRVATVATACSLCILAGIISGGGPFALGNPRFRVSADSASVEPLGIGTAQWTADWLGPDHRFYADRTNRLLLATYGRQQVVTTLYDKIDLEPVMFAPDLNQAHLHALRETDVDYLALDRRLTLQLPVVGWYFDPGRVYHEPPHLAAFHKFTGIPGIDRVYDNGFVSIADVRKFRDGR